MTPARPVLPTLLTAGLLAAAAAPATAAAPARTLPEGLALPPQTTPLAPTLLLPGPLTQTLDLLSVTGPPAAVWRTFTADVDRRFPGQGIDPDAAPGCGAEAARTVCTLALDVRDARGDVVTVAAFLMAPPDDVTGRYVLRVTTTRDARSGAAEVLEPPAAAGGTTALKPVVRSRSGLAVGGPIAPKQVGQRYKLLPGSRLESVFGTGSATGGFDALLSVRPGAKVTALGAAYARQARQVPGRIRVLRLRKGGTVTTRWSPPGAAGGYSGDIVTVDRPGAGDYVVYSLLDD